MSAAVTKWLLGLSQVTASAEPVNRERIGAMTALIGRDFPDSAFCVDSLSFVASASPFWPAYADLVKHLGAWWRDNRPSAHLAISDTRVAALSSEDQAWLAYWRAHRSDRGMQEQRMLASAQCRLDPAQLPLAKLASLVRSNSSRAWEVILSDELVSVAA